MTGLRSGHHKYPLQTGCAKEVETAPAVEESAEDISADIEQDISELDTLEQDLADLENLEFE